jgi:SAM-dependent methyltransferase
MTASLPRRVLYHAVLRPLYYLLGVYRVYLESPATFAFRGKRYPYFHHWHGMTYLIERIVEVPIIWERVQAHRGQRILEVGNCLSFFFPRSHDVIDKYDTQEGVMHVDIVDFQPAAPYDLIVSISTIEHVGWDEPEKDPDKTRVALEKMIRCLAPNGELVVTWALGYNPHIDRLLREGQLRFSETYFMKRVTHYSNRWQEVGWNDVKDARYGAPFRSGNAIVIGVVRLDATGQVIAASWPAAATASSHAS